MPAHLDRVNRPGSADDDTYTHAASEGEPGPDRAGCVRAETESAPLEGVDLKRTGKHGTQRWL